MLSFKSSDKLTRGKNQTEPKNLDNQKMDRLRNGVEHLVTYPIMQLHAPVIAILLNPSQVPVNYILNTLYSPVTVVSLVRQAVLYAQWVPSG